MVNRQIKLDVVFCTYFTLISKNKKSKRDYHFAEACLRLFLMHIPVPSACSVSKSSTTLTT